MGFSGTVAIRAMKDGDYQATIFPGTASGLQQALDFAGLLGAVQVGPGTITGITNLTMYGKCRLAGAGMFSTVLRRDPAATGTMLREKSGAEGNVSGGVGIIVSDITLDGNSAAGDGINFGNQGGSVFTSGARLSDVYVYNFSSGTGVTLLSNAIHCRNVWSLFNTVGFDLTGAANHFSGFWGEGNVTAQLIQRGAYNTFAHLQLEQNGVVSTNMVDLKANASGNQFFGVYMALSGNSGQLIINRASAHNNAFYGVTVASGGFTWTNTIYTESGTFGTGSVIYIAQYVDQTNTTKSFLYNQSTGGSSTLVGSKYAPEQVDTTGSLSVATTTALTGDVTVGTAGSGSLVTVGQGTADGTSGSLRLRSGQGQSVIWLNEDGTDYGKIFQTASNSFWDFRGSLSLRAGVGGSAVGVLTSAGNLSCAGSMTVGNLTSGKYPKISTAGLLIDGPTPLAGTKVYYVSDTSGGAVNRKLTFIDGILTAET